MIHSEDFLLKLTTHPHPPPPQKKKKKKKIYEKKNCESRKMGTEKIPSEYLWYEGWPVWGYVGVELAQTSFNTLSLHTFSFS